MALGTNYSRNPSLKQIDDFHVRVAKAEINKGKSKKEYLSMLAPAFRAHGEEIWERAIRELSERVARREGER
jgi:hypothetical protein